MATTKKAPKKKTSAKKAPAKKARSKAAPAKAPSATKKVWEYIKKNTLQDRLKRS